MTTWSGILRDEMNTIEGCAVLSRNTEDANSQPNNSAPSAATYIVFVGYGRRRVA